jgi:hypothetical protein
VQSHCSRCGHHLIHVHLPEARDVLGKRATEELDALRQVTDVRPQLRLVPGMDIDAIEPHLAVRCRPDAHHQARQSRFSGRRRADDGQNLSGRVRLKETPRMIAT